VSSSRPEGAELAALLARKAQADATATRELAGNPEITDEIVGFHAQQAIEKWLKAAMANCGLEEVRIHDIGRLVELLEKEGAELPEVRDKLDELTIYAVPLRYDELLDAEPLDRDTTIAMVDEVGRWAEARLSEVAADDESGGGGRPRPSR
jgi:HEPN domain-containing protein